MSRFREFPRIGQIRETRSFNGSSGEEITPRVDWPHQGMGFLGFLNSVFTWHAQSPIASFPQEWVRIEERSLRKADSFVIFAAHCASMKISVCIKYDYNTWLLFGISCARPSSEFPPPRSPHHASNRVSRWMRRLPDRYCSVSGLK